MIRYLLFLLLAIGAIPGNAKAFRRHSISLSDGIGSAEQWRNVLGDHTREYTRQGIPLLLSGAAFITYRYVLDDRFSLGITAGFDNSTGRITRSRNRYSLPAGSLGGYQRRSRTIAAELRLVYYSNEEETFYGLVGGGYTFSNVRINYVDDVYNEMSKRYPGVLGDDPRVINDNRLAHQVTLFGYRTNGPFSVFTEIGFGYKGLLHFGLSYEF